MFQNAIAKVIDGIEGALHMSHDIVIFAMVEHDKHLKQVLQRLHENGLTANLPKCEFRKPTMEFYGMMFSKDGIEPDPMKVDVLIMMAPQRRLDRYKVSQE